MAEYKCGDCFHAELCEKSEMLVGFSRDNPAYCGMFLNSADVAPVRHARWVQVIVHVEVDDGFVDRVSECCSACHESNGRRRTYFCPNCGAKMDGGADR